MKAQRSEAGDKKNAPLIPMAQAIRESGLTRRTLNGLIATGQLAVFELPTKRKLLRRADLEKLRTAKECR